MREFAKFFDREIKEQRNKTSGNRYRTSKGGSKRNSSRVRFASDLLSKQEQKEYTKSGKVETYNMYETIIPKYEFDFKDKELQKTMLTRWREIYDNKKIMEEMGISNNNTFYGLLKELDVPQKPRGGTRGARTRKVSVEPKQLTYIPPTTPAPIEEPVTPAESPVVQLVTNGLHLQYNGKFDSEQLSKIFTKLQLLIDGEENGFNVSISLTEIEKPL